MVGRRHVNEFLHTGLVNSGRIAGIGIAYDDYSEQSFPDHQAGSGVQVRFPNRNEEEIASLNGPVITYKLSDLKG